MKSVFMYLRKKKIKYQEKDILFLETTSISYVACLKRLYYIWGINLIEFLKMKTNKQILWGDKILNFFSSEFTATIHGDSICNVDVFFLWTIPFTCFSSIKTWINI